MLQVTIPSVEYYDEIENQFSTIKEQTIQLEHSLIAIAKWESKHKKIFLAKNTKKTNAEIIDYIRCMTITQNVDPRVYNNLSTKNLEDIDNYIIDPMTATTFSNNRSGSNREPLSAELIYYWMIAHNIPIEFQKWHLNRLITLIRVCNIKNESPKKRSQSELLNRNAALNAARRQQLNTNG